MFAKFRKILALGMLLMPLQTALAAGGIVAIGADTVAGNPTILKANNLSADELINFVVTKPDGLVLTVPASANENGVAQVELYDYHTRLAGTYGLSAYKAGTSFGSALKSSFKVYPGEVDISKSTAQADRSIIKADGADSAQIRVDLVDEFNNPVPGRAVKLISSRNNDSVVPSSKITDSNGEADFTLSSSEKGSSYFSVLDTTEDLLLNQRVQISFVDPDTYLADAGGDLIKTAFAADVGPLAAFDLTDFPTTIQPNQNITFKVKAVDASDQVVQDYTGTIRFSAEGDNSSGVTLPANYKFLAEDLGQHQFNLGLSFTQAGTYKIIVNDLTDKFKKGEKTVIVGGSSGSGSGSTDSGTGTAEKPTISTPAAGSYSQAQQTVSGKAKASSNVKVYDNSQEIGSAVAGTTGKFSFQTPALQDGKHSIYVVSLDPITNEVIANSDPVEITIDTTPPKVDDLQLDPSTGIKAGSVINVKVFSEPKLSQAALIFNSDIVPLTASIDDPSVYVGTIQAPAAAGAYGLNVLVSDELSNEKTYENVATVNVDPAGGKIDKTLPDKTGTGTSTGTTTGTTTPPTTGTDTGTGTTVTPPAANPPSQVTGVIAYGSDKRVTLVWDAATGDKTIKYYKIYYGADVKNLSQNVVTKDASTTWYIPNLENGKEYFFAVAAIDETGAESENRSEIVSGIPFMLEIKNALSQAPTQPLNSDNLKPAAYSGPFPPSSSQTGPEVLWLIVPSLGLAGLLKKKK